MAASGSDLSYVVRDDDGRVVVIFAGKLAPAAADDWARRGYQVDAVALQDAAPVLALAG